MLSLEQDVLQGQISQLDLLMAMYPSSDELIIDASLVSVIEEIKSWCSNGVPQPRPKIPPSIAFAINIPLEGLHDQRSVRMNIEIPLSSVQNGTSKALAPKLSIRQPNWMNKAAYVSLSTGLPQDDILSAIEYIHEEASRFVAQNHAGNILNGPSPMLVSHSDTDIRISRVWFYFPSLSTRDKRQDLVNHAPEYGLTGFVLAGKPGMLCLEGASKNIDAYMKFIKTESWGDIPSHQKKVSERYRENGKDVQRVFSDMIEITDVLGEKRGERANRGDMKALESWLAERGLGQAFTQVLL